MTLQLVGALSPYQKMYTADGGRNTLSRSRFRLHHNVCQSASAVMEIARITESINALDYIYNNNLLHTGVKTGSQSLWTIHWYWFCSLFIGCFLTFSDTWSHGAVKSKQMTPSEMESLERKVDDFVSLPRISSEAQQRPVEYPHDQQQLLGQQQHQLH